MRMCHGPDGHQRPALHLSCRPVILAFSQPALSRLAPCLSVGPLTLVALGAAGCCAARAARSSMAPASTSGSSRPGSQTARTASRPGSCGNGIKCPILQDTTGMGSCAWLPSRDPGVLTRSPTRTKCVPIYFRDVPFEFWRCRNLRNQLVHHAMQKQGHSALLQCYLWVGKAWNTQLAMESWRFLQRMRA
jgi:hypothetical protein